MTPTQVNFVIARYYHLLFYMNVSVQSVPVALFASLCHPELDVVTSMRL